MAIKLMPNMNIKFVEKKIQFIPDPILYYKGKKSYLMNQFILHHGS